MYEQSRPPPESVWTQLTFFIIFPPSILLIILGLIVGIFAISFCQQWLHVKYGRFGQYRS